MITKTMFYPLVNGTQKLPIIRNYSSLPQDYQIYINVNTPLREQDITKTHERAEKFKDLKEQEKAATLGDLHKGALWEQNGNKYEP